MNMSIHPNSTEHSLSRPEVNHRYLHSNTRKLQKFLLIFWQSPLKYNLAHLYYIFSFPLVKIGFVNQLDKFRFRSRGDILRSQAMLLQSLYHHGCNLVGRLDREHEANEGLVFLDIFTHLCLTQPIAAHGVYRSDVSLSPVVNFFIGLARIKFKYLFAFVFLFLYRNIHSLSLYGLSLLLKLCIFAVFLLDRVGFVFGNIGELKFVKIEHGFSQQ